MMQRQVWILSGLLLLAGAGAAAQADEGDDSIYAPGTSASIELGGYHTDFAYADGKHAVDINRYAVTLGEPINEDATFGLQGGYFTLGVDNATLMPLAESGGRFLGLFGDYNTRQGDYLNFEARLSYTWYGDSFRGPNQQADVTWYETQVSAGPVFRWQRWRVSAGGFYQRFDGTETDSGSLNQKLDFSADRGGGAYFGFAYFLDRTGSLGIYATGGARHGINLVFKREF